jgi:zinc D-Ala-D-Ala carboxypeptidase
MTIPLPSVQRLERVRVRCGFPFLVSSADRCPEYNAKKSETGSTGPHTRGAFDIVVLGAQALLVVVIAHAEGFTGIGVRQHGDHKKRIVHLDDLPNSPGQPRPWLWSYP